MNARCLSPAVTFPPAADRRQFVLSLSAACRDSRDCQHDRRQQRWTRQRRTGRLGRVVRQSSLPRHRTFRGSSKSTYGVTESNTACVQWPFEPAGKEPPQSGGVVVQGHAHLLDVVSISHPPGGLPRRLDHYGLRGFWFSEERRRGFVERAEEAGATCDVLQVPRASGPWASWQKPTGLLVRWLKQLRPPAGLLAVQDYRARAAMEECERLGLRTPHDVAVIGMETCF
jgi:hypothetical protein